MNSLDCVSNLAALSVYYSACPSATVPSMTSPTMSCIPALTRIAFFVIAPLIIATLLQLLGDIGTRDSIAYWAATQVFLNNGNPYDPNLLLTFQQSVSPPREAAQLFLNPPWTLPPLVVLGSGSFATFAFLLLTLNISCSLFALGRLVRIFAPLPPRYLLIVGTFFPVLSSWYFGQLSFCLILGSVMALEWVRQGYKPWWKALVALLLLSVKPQAPYLIIVVILVTIVQRLPRSDVVKLMVSSSPLVAFLLLRYDLVLKWIASFQYSGQWATSSLPSLLCNTFPSINHALFLALPPLLIALSAIVFLQRGVTPYQFIWCLIVSSLTAPYAWIFDFAPLVIVVYVVMVVANGERTSPVIRAFSLTVLAALCTPFEGLLTNDLQAYVLHPLLVTAALFLNRYRVCCFLEKRTC